MPYIICNDLLQYADLNIDDLIINKIKSALQSIGCKTDKINNSMYKGIIRDQLDRPYVLVNITGLYIYELNLTRNTMTWFVLPSEIINTKKICNIDIDDEISDLFTSMPELALLTNTKTNQCYIIPDAVYTTDEYKTVLFKSVFGHNMKKYYSTCGEYYYFYRSFCDSFYNLKKKIQKETEKEKENEKENLSNTNNKYGMNRYALFVEGNIYIESQSQFSLTDNMINSLYPEPCLIIGYSNLHEKQPDILVKDYNQFIALSYHEINNNEMNNSSIVEPSYMIV